MKRMVRSLWTVGALLLAGNLSGNLDLAVQSARAEDAPAAATEVAAQTVSYYRDIRPIFQERCQGCHQPAKRGGEFLMTSFEEMQKGGDSGVPAVVAGKPEESLLLEQITPAADGTALMPKGTDPLTPAQVELVKLWIVEGAVNDTPPMAHVAVDQDHPPIYPAAPVVTSLAYSPDGSLLAVSGYHEVLLHKVDGSEIVARLVGQSERIESIVFSPDGKYLAVAGGSPARFGEIQIWEVATRALTLSLPVTYDTIYGASWSSDGTKLAFGCADNTVRAIDVATGKQVLFSGAHSDWALDTVFSTDNSHLVSVSRDRTVKLVEVATERFVDNVTSITPGALKGGLMTLARHPTKDEVVIGGADGIPKIYKLYRTQARVIGDDFNLIRKFDGLPGRIFAAEYSADGTRVVVGSSQDGQGEVRVYQEADGVQVSKFAGQMGPVFSVAFRPDGKEVAVAGFDGTVRLYNPDDGVLVKEFSSVPITPAEVAAVPPAATPVAPAN